MNYRDDVHEDVGISEIIAMPGASEPRKRQCKEKEKTARKIYAGRVVAREPDTRIQASKDLGMDADAVLGHPKSQNPHPRPAEIQGDDKSDVDEL